MEGKEFQNPNNQENQEPDQQPEQVIPAPRELEEGEREELRKLLKEVRDGQK